MAEISTLPLMEDESVRELLDIMRENHVPTMQNFLDVLTHVAEIEKQFNAAVSELQAIRQELSSAQQQNHPAKTSLRNVVHTMENNISTMRERLEAVKQSIIDGCKNAVSAFKEKGIAALGNIARFFKIRPILEAMRNDLNESIQRDDKAISKIEAASTEYHQAGRHIKNMARAVVGKEAIQGAKSPGKLAKVLETPFKRERSNYMHLKKDVEGAINLLTRLERAVERKPSIQKTMQTLNEQIAKAPKSISPPAVRRDER